MFFGYHMNKFYFFEVLLMLLQKAFDLQLQYIHSTAGLFFAYFGQLCEPWWDEVLVTNRFFNREGVWLEGDKGGGDAIAFGCLGQIRLCARKLMLDVGCSVPSGFGRAICDTESDTERERGMRKEEKRDEEGREWERERDEEGREEGWGRKRAGWGRKRERWGRKRAMREGEGLEREWEWHLRWCGYGTTKSAGVVVGCPFHCITDSSAAALVPQCHRPMAGPLYYTIIYHSTSVLHRYLYIVWIRIFLKI
jgi:hypothetical protein